MSQLMGTPLNARASARAREMPPFLVMEVLERAAALEREGRSIIHLEVGEPDFDTPKVIVAAAERALRDGRTHYTHSMGHPELREAIAEWHLSQYGVETSPDCIAVTMGSSGAMLLVFAALLDAGARVLLTDPHYACYPNFVTAFGGVPVRIPVCEADGFQFGLDEVAAQLDPRPAALMLNSPANPTGTVTSPERMKQLVDLVGDRATIVSDEIYHGLVYGERAHSIREFAPEAVVVNGFSKLFAMTGWRLGYVVLPTWLVRPVQKLQQNLFISPPDFPQLAAIAALREAEADVERMRRAYDERRRLMLGRLHGMGLSPLTEPLGAFYVFVNVGRFADDVYQFAFRILDEAGVAVTPGVDFGPGGQGYLRLSYANSLANIEEGMDRLAVFLDRVLEAVGLIGYSKPVAKSDARQFAVELARIADDHKSEDVIALDLRGISSVTDFTVICTGTSDRQMRSAADRMIEYGKMIGERPYGFCGREGATWIVIDFVDVVVHLFSRTHRTYYDLELLWGDAPRLEWARSATA